MSVKRVLQGIVVFASVGLGTAPASAAVTALSAGVLFNGGPVVTFDSSPASSSGTILGPVTLGGISFSGSGLIFNASNGNSAQPLYDHTNYLTILGGGSETLGFSQPRRRFGLYIGSLDTYNSIEFLNNGMSVATFDGNAIVAGAGVLAGLAANGGQSSDASNRFVSFAFSAAQSFDTVILRSASNSFEVDNISAVPEPSTWAMMLVGFLGLGFVVSRKSKTVNLAAS